MHSVDDAIAQHPLSVGNLGIDLWVYPSWVPAHPDTSLGLAFQVLGHTDAALSAVEDGCDAVIIDSVGDFGLEVIRSVISIPVLGPGQIAMNEASRSGRKFGIVTVWPASMNFILEDRLAAARCESLCVGIVNIKRQSDLERLTGRQGCLAGADTDHDRLVESITSATASLVKKNGAEAVMLGCTCMFGLAEDVSSMSQVPVIDPFRVALDAARITQPLAQRPAINPDNERLLRAMIDAVAHDGIADRHEHTLLGS